MRPPIDVQRERAEKLLNGVRAAVLVLMAGAAIAYAPHIPDSVRRANTLVLVPALIWSLVQFPLYVRERPLPGWLAVANPLVDITAVTAILGGYGIAQSASLALKSPIFLAYFAILAARPIASSTRKAAAAAVLAVVEYTALLGFLAASGRLVLVESPITASSGPGVSPLDEGAKLLLLIVAGAVATYATAWHERLANTYFRESHEREELRVALTQAQLQSLKLQLSPHFLFNALNSISALITTDAAAAERMLTGLSDFLRLSLHNAGQQEVPLEREVQLLERYVMIQQLRFQDRLRVDISMDPGASRALVPNLILQPLAENAIRHGLAPRARGGKLTIDATRENGSLVLRVSDDGVGQAMSPDELSMGIGLGNTRERLERLYGAAHRFEIETKPDEGFTVRIVIPFHTDGAPT
ncbi:MAG: histidine kinase [Gemmatimonadota bacterium]|nr:histidine kinase [Gemmatimonadota bacterium]